MASCVDDAELKISHIIRGQDHLSNTYKHILILQALGAEVPTFGHLPLLLGPDHSKLSKRKHGPIVSVTNYRDAGFLPQAFINYMALLGWSPKSNQEVLTLAEMLEKFDMNGILKTNAVVQFEESGQEGGVADWAPPKAVWLNGQHLRTMPVEELMPHVQPLLEDAGLSLDETSESDRPAPSEIVDQIRSRYTMLGDFPLRGQGYFSNEFETEAKAQANLDKDGARDLMHALADRIEALDEFSEETAEQALRSLAEEREVKAGLLINASRAALSGQSVGPSAFTVFRLIGKERVVQRLRAC